jgi:hypothetical protein
LALTTQRAPTVPNPGRRQKASPLPETGGPMAALVVAAGAGGPESARGSTTGLARPRPPRRLPPHFLGPSGGGRTAAAADSALGCATLLCSGCFLGCPLPPPLPEAAAWRLGGGGGGGVISRTSSM